VVFIATRPLRKGERPFMQRGARAKRKVDATPQTAWLPQALAAGAGTTAPAREGREGADVRDAAAVAANARTRQTAAGCGACAGCTARGQVRMWIRLQEEVPSEKLLRRADHQRGSCLRRRGGGRRVQLSRGSRAWCHGRGSAICCRQTRGQAPWESAR
jgi:hypothetical protein